MTAHTENFEYLGEKHFAATLSLIFLLHLLFAYGWAMIPKTNVINIPVRALNIRLGDSDAELQEEAPPPPVPTESSEQLDAAINRLTRQENKQETAPKPIKKTLAPSSDNIPAPRQFVRKSADNIEKKNAKNNGINIGNSTAKNAESKARYEQAISLWVQKFLRYPEEAKTAGIQGRAIVRIRIDRLGNIRYSGIESSAGYDILDNAALDMIRRANPVPAVPNDYPDGDAFEFLIPASFKFE